MINHKHTFVKNSSGFTMVESLVAISILVIAIVASSSVMQGAISSYIYSKDQIIAFYLAQEGFEQIRNLRDENRLVGRNWLYGIAENSNDPCYFGNACIADGVTTSLTRCPGVGSCPVMRQDTSTGFYGHNSSWPTTIFRREITLSTVNSSQEVMVTVTVSWNKGMVSRQFKAKETLFNW